MLQAWTFGYHGDYWTNELVEAFLSRVLRERLLILDLACDRGEMWRSREAVRVRPWIFSIMHDNGQHTAMYGTMADSTRKMHAAVLDPNHGGLAGAGLEPEGIEHNSAFWELCTDQMWRENLIDLASWTRDYAAQRYGSCPDAMARAWSLLCQTVYAQLRAPTPSYVIRPLPRVRSGYKGSIGYEPARMAEAVECFLACANELGGSDLYRRDLVDVCKAHLANAAEVHLQQALVAYREGQTAAIRQPAETYMQIVSDIERLVATRPEYRLSRWIAVARACAANPARGDPEADLYEWNARMQITRWGGPLSLTDYAWKEWAGLIGDFYLPRWRMFFEEAERTGAAQSFDEKAWHERMDEWEYAWAKQTNEIPEPAAGDAVALAAELMR